VSLAGIFRPLQDCQSLSSLRLKQRLDRPAANIKLGGQLLLVSCFEYNAVLCDLAQEEEGDERKREGRVTGIQTLCAPGKRKQKTKRVENDQSKATGAERACQLVSSFEHHG